MDVDRGLCWLGDTEIVLYACFDEVQQVQVGTLNECVVELGVKWVPGLEMIRGVMGLQAPQ